MDIDEIIHWLKEMQSPAMSEAELYCAGSCYGQGDKAYPYPEDYALDEAINALEQLKEYQQLEEKDRLIKLPCKVGDKIYSIYCCLDDRESVFSGDMTQAMIKEEYNKAIDDLISKCESAKFADDDETVLSDIHQGVNSGLSMAIHFAKELRGGENE